MAKVLIDGKWIEAAVKTVAKGTSTGRWVNGKWVRYTASDMIHTTNPVVAATTKKIAHTRLPEGMLPEELTSADMTKIISSRYHSMRHTSKYNSRIISTDMAKQLKVKSNTPSSGIRVEETGTMWTYRKPSTIKDNILDFEVLPMERVSMSVNAHPDIINVLDGFIARGEVIVNGKIVKTMKPPKAYYKITAEPLEQFATQSDPITMYFREPATKEQLEAIKRITEPFKGLEEVAKADKMFHSGKLEGASWLSHAKENTPEDLYKAFKRAQGIDPKLAQAVYNQKGTKISGINLKVYDTYDVSVDTMIKHMENYRYRISAGQQFAIDSFIDDYAKAIGKSGFEVIG